MQQSQERCWRRWRQLAKRSGGLEASQQLLGSLRHDRRRALLRGGCMQMCSALQRAVFCDWRAPSAAR